MRSVGPTRKVAKGGESGWEAGGVSRARSAAGGGPGARVAAPSGPGAGGVMRRVTLFLNGSPRNGKVSGGEGATRGLPPSPPAPDNPGHLGHRSSQAPLSPEQRAEVPSHLPAAPSCPFPC